MTCANVLNSLPWLVCSGQLIKGNDYKVLTTLGIAVCLIIRLIRLEYICMCVCVFNSTIKTFRG